MDKIKKISLLVLMWSLFIGINQCALAGFTEYSDTVLNIGPVLYYHLDEPTGSLVLDASGNGHTGIIHGGVKFKVPSVWSTLGSNVSSAGDTAMEFDGIDGYIDTGFSTNPPLKRWSIIAWVKGNSAPGNNLNGIIMGENNFQIVWDHPNSQFKGAASFRQNGTWYDATFGLLEANKWYLLAATYDGNRLLKAYKDGILIYSNDSPSGPPDGNDIHSDNTVKIGRHMFHNDMKISYFAGTIDEVILFDKVLTDAQILNLYKKACEANSGKY